MTLKEITSTLKESEKVYGKICNVEIIGDELVQVNKATGIHHPFTNGMYQIKLQIGQRIYVKKLLS